MKIKNIISLLLIFSFTTILSQTISIDKITNLDIEDVSNSELLDYVNQAKAEGYELEDLYQMAKIKGISISKISSFRNRVNSLLLNKKNDNNSLKLSQSKDLNVDNVYGIENFTDVEIKVDSLFGMKFFNNPKISFTPNINVANPETYQLGPGDNILIDLWGASDKAYDLTVDRYGAVKIKNLGPIYIGGLEIRDAKSKLILNLKKIYSGIGSDNINDKVYVNVSLLNVRTINVNIIGEVQAPGTYSITALSTVINALYSAGGPTENGTFRKIEIVRNGNKLQEFDIYNYLINGDESGNIFLKDQDLIIIKPYENKVKISGSIKTPGYYELKSNQTFKDLLQYTGGFSSNAYYEKIIITRFDGKEKILKEINQKNLNNFILKDGDDIFIKEVVDRISNKVTIEGPVYQPGDYEFVNGLTLKDLFKKAEGFKNNVDLNNGIIYRTNDNVNFKTISFIPTEILSSFNDVKLKINDRVKVYTKNELSFKKYLTINGAVNNPAQIQFVSNMSAFDLLAIGGGLKYGSNINKIDVFRRVLDEKNNTLSKYYSLSGTAQLKSFILEENDVISVRNLVGFEDIINIELKGQVFYPGYYSIENKNERISEILKKAGGIIDDAYVEASYVERKKLEININDSIQTDTFKTYKIGIDLSEKNNDFILKNGDKIIIPKFNSTVTVNGEILNSTILEYDENNSFKDYINSSGGFSDEANISKSYVIYINGKSRNVKSFLFFKIWPKVLPGSTLIVPKKSVKEKTSITELLSITTAIGTLGVLIQSVK